MQEADIFYRAMLARDYRFDGKFYVGVKTTGIYCRPICPAKPKRENVTFFKSALQAERAGYRPCLRCRPESAPHSAAWVGTSAVVQRALRLIQQASPPTCGETRFAARLGLSARHLRRLFEEEIGKTPKQIADLHRLDFARKLILETSIPFTQIAFTSGFTSIRRFNDAILKRFSKAPRDLRKKKESSEKDPGVSLTLSYRPPFAWSSLLRHFEKHQVPGIDRVVEGTYERVFKLNGKVGSFRVLHEELKSRLVLRVSSNQTENLWSIVQRVRQMFDLDSDPLIVANAFSNCRLLGKILEKAPGLRVPRGWDVFETLICTVLGQLVSTTQATRLIGQLVRNYGEKVKHPETGEEGFLFPTPKTLATSELSEVGTTASRKSCIREISHRVLKSEISLDSAQDPNLFREALLSTKGIGPWTAEYVSLRALGDTDAFPGTDLILKRVVAEQANLKLESVKPWRAYAAMHLWKEFAK